MSQYFSATSFKNAPFLNVSGTPPISIACWVNFVGVTATQYFLNVNETALRVATSGIISLYVSGGGASVDVSCATSVTSSIWYHVAGVKAAHNDNKIYLNGVLEKSDSTLVSSPDFSILNVGSKNDAGANPFNGSLAEVGIWQDTLTQDDITALAKGFTPIKIKPNTLKAYYPLIREAGA